MRRSCGTGSRGWSRESASGLKSLERLREGLRHARDDTVEWWSSLPPLPRCAGERGKLRSKEPGRDLGSVVHFDLSRGGKGRVPLTPALSRKERKTELLRWPAVTDFDADFPRVAAALPPLLAGGAGALSCRVAASAAVSAGGDHGRRGLSAPGRDRLAACAASAGAARGASGLAGRDAGRTSANLCLSAGGSTVSPSPYPSPARAGERYVATCPAAGEARSSARPRCPR